MNLYLLSVGFVSILAQVVIIRELNVAFFGVELIYVLAIAVWLLSTAFGALIGRRTRLVPKTRVGGLFVVFALFLPANVVFIRALRAILGGVPGAYLSFGLQLIGLLAALLPVGVVLGLLFQWAAKAYIGGKTKTLAKAYAIESVGGVFGGLASTLLLMFGIQNFSIGVGCSLAALVSVAAAPGPRGINGNRARYASVAVFPVLLVLALMSGRVDRELTRIDHPTLVATRDSPYSRITATRQEDQFIVFENGALAFETQSPAAEELVHLAATYVDTLERVLVLGGGVEGTVAEILKYSPEHVDYVELNPVLVSLVEGYLPRDNWEPIRAKRVTLTIADPRRFVKMPALYDFIVIGAADPTTAQSNRFYTREFFERCKAILARKGVLALRLRSSENIWTPFVTYRNTSIFRALKTVFRDVVVLPGTTNIVVASDMTLDRDPASLAARFENRRITTRLVTPEYISYLYTNDRFFEIARLLSTTEIPANTDARPICYRYSSMIWLSKFFPRLITADTGSLGTASPEAVLASVAIAVVLCAAFVAARRRVRFQRTVLAAVAGFIGMVLETALILHYQAKSGVLYQNLGLLLMVFMGGLAVGAWLVSRAARREPDNLWSLNRLWGRRLFGGFVLLSLAFIGILKFDYPAGILVVSLLLFIVGFLVAGVFAYASFLGRHEQSGLVSPLYAADLFGGCLGSVVGSIFLIPFVGLEQTAGAIALLSLAAVLAV